MTPAQLAVAAGADPKWLINSRALLHRRPRYTAGEARWWGLVRILNQSFEVPLQRAGAAATTALGRGTDATWINVQRDASASASLIVNLARYESVFLANLSRALVLETPRRRGRPRPRAKDPVRAAAEHGVDIGLLRSALRRTPAERLELLEANLGFLRDIRQEKRMRLRSMLTDLTTREIAFVVVGGVAEVASGSSLVTGTLDICYDPGRSENVNALGELLAGWKAYPRGVEPGRPFIMDGKTLLGAPVMALTSGDGDITVMDRVAAVGPYRSVRAHFEAMTAFGIKFRVLDLPSLIQSKRAAGRPRDFEHLPELEALLALRGRE